MNRVDNTVSEAAAKLKLSPASIRRLIASRSLTAIRAGERKWIVPDEAIQEYRKRQTSAAIDKGTAGGEK